MRGPRVRLHPTGACRQLKLNSALENEVIYCTYLAGRGLVDKEQLLLFDTFPSRDTDTDPPRETSRGPLNAPSTAFSLSSGCLFFLSRRSFTLIVRPRELKGFPPGHTAYSP